MQKLRSYFKIKCSIIKCSEKKGLTTRLNKMRELSKENVLRGKIRGGVVF